MKSRIEINEAGDFFIIIPNDVVDTYSFDEGDELEWDTNDPDYIILEHA